MLRSSIAVAPRVAAALYALGLTLIRTKCIDEAIEQLKTSELEPDNPRYSYIYGVGSRSTGRVADARIIWEVALKFDPTNGEILSVLPQDARQAKDFGRATEFAERF
jgi:Flp pilus assembly protein TadD